MNNSHIHYRYIILILGLIIISLLTFRYSADAPLSSYISFAATISSLLLAILAIVQGFLSSNSMSSSINILHNSSSEIAKNSTDLTNILNQFGNKLPELAEMPNQIKGLQDILTNNINEVLKSSIENFPENVIDSFYENITLKGKVLMYAISKSFEMKQPLDLIKIQKQEEKDQQKLGQASYNLGIIAALNRFDLISLEASAQSIKIQKINPHLFKLSMDIEKILKENLNSDEMPGAIESKNRIDSYFNISIDTE